jgi:hypothetical protein
MVAGDAVNFELVLYTPPSGDAVNFELAVEVPPPFLIGFGVSGKLGEVGEPDPLNVKGIYQMRMTKRGKVPIKMKFYVPFNPQTAPQQANRQKFADAMTAWGALTSEQKSVYNMRAKKRQMFGWGLFIREYYQEN